MSDKTCFVCVSACNYSLLKLLFLRHKGEENL